MHEINISPLVNEVLPPAASFIVCLNKFFDGSVIRSFYIIREETGWNLFHSPVILEAFTTVSLAAAWLPGTIASLHIFIGFTFSHS